MLCILVGIYYIYIWKIHVFLEAPLTDFSSMSSGKSVSHGMLGRMMAFQKCLHPNP